MRLIKVLRLTTEAPWGVRLKAPEASFTLRGQGLAWWVCLVWFSKPCSSLKSFFHWNKCNLVDQYVGYNVFDWLLVNVSYTCRLSRMCVSLGDGSFNFWFSDPPPFRYTHFHTHYPTAIKGVDPFNIWACLLSVGEAVAAIFCVSAYAVSFILMCHSTYLS